LRLLKVSLISSVLDLPLGLVLPVLFPGPIMAPLSLMQSCIRTDGSHSHGPRRLGCFSFYVEFSVYAESKEELEESWLFLQVLYKAKWDAISYTQNT